MAGKLKYADERQTNKVLPWIIAGIIIFAVLLAFFARKPQPLIPKPTSAHPVVIKGKIAIVLDDWGYRKQNLQLLASIKSPLTLAVLPHLPYSKYIAQQYRAMGYEIILHLPMQPFEKNNLEKNTIMAGMDEQAIAKIITGALSSITTASGVSNHMGSMVTADTKTMGIVLKELKKHKLYFLDSYVSAKSVARELAGQSGVLSARRDIFLDNNQDAAYIRSQLIKLKNKARPNRAAIGIGHDRILTITVLKEMMPELEKEGYRFVFVSDAVS